MVSLGSFISCAIFAGQRGQVDVFGQRPILKNNAVRPENGPDPSPFPQTIHHATIIRLLKGANK
jgi:hypothetical protein